jgi:hypothetical protein
MAHALGVGERNYTLRGEGWFDGGNQRFARIDLREARMTLRDNGEFAVTLFVRNERYLVRGRWDRRGRGNVERIDIHQAFGSAASGSGTLHYQRDAGQPERLTLEGRTRDGAFRAEISDGRGYDWNDPRNREGFEIGRGTRLYTNLDVETSGSGTLRYADARDGRFARVRAVLRTNRDVHLEFEGRTRGVLRAEITDIRDGRVTAQVRELMGSRADGELRLVFRDRAFVERVEGGGRASNGSWQLDFDGRAGGWNGRDDDWGRNDDWGWEGRGSDVDERGSGWLRQDVGPSLTFDRMRARLDHNRVARIWLEGRRQTVEIRGEWREDGNGVSIEMQSVNGTRARGRLELRRTGWNGSQLTGEGRTDLGRFEVRFQR